MNLCKYKDIFGKPNEGVHQYRLFDVALVDLIITIVASILIGIWFNYNMIIVFIILMILGLFLHKLFCVETTLTKLIFY